jgi:hypothetical protein
MQGKSEVCMEHVGGSTPIENPSGTGQTSGPGQSYNMSVPQSMQQSEAVPSLESALPDVPKDAIKPAVTNQGIALRACLSQIGTITHG